MLQRKGVSTETAVDDIAVYREGVRVMRERSNRDPMDPLGWVYQSRIHGNPRGAERQPDEPVDWSSCQHGSWFFLPWHRMSLLQFERIIQAATGEPEWALPYWDYPDASNVTIPDAFLDESSSLFQPGRDFRPREFAPPSWQDSGSFIAFGGGARETPVHRGQELGSLELNPHNVVHGVVSGAMASFQSPLDPLFYIHHCAIDRFWEVWLTLGDRRNPDKDSWLGSSFSFPDPEAPNGRRVLFVRDVQTAAAAGYCYADLTPPSSAMERKTMAQPSERERTGMIPQMAPRRKDEDLELLGATSRGGTVRDRAEIGVAADALERRRSHLADEAARGAEAGPLPLLLRLENVGIEAGDASSMWNVYVRAGGEGERHLAGTIAPFGLAGLTAEGGRQTLTMDISHLSDELLGAGGALEVTFESVYDDAEGEPFYDRAALYTTAE
ncbi:MAG TPA: tyrosinase family protein [Acidimicrobiales bacterium]|nr:tyrosinase family protein [Acidimicrobiales bacterium]